MYLQELTKREPEARRRKKLAVYRIGDEYVNSEEIAERLEVSRTQAHQALKRAREIDGPITWERLRECRR